jgi:ABC-type branched-subunit amino acid transport system substrate-binding protein
MNKRLLVFLLVNLCLATLTIGQEMHKYTVAYFVPLHLDSTFDAANNYKFGKTFPRQSISGLEFYTGAEFALDSLRTEKDKVEVRVFDIRSSQGAISTVAASPVMDSIDLIIGQVSGSEYLQLANIAKTRNIPFVSATYPNDGGIKNNPQVVIVNSKLNTHIQSLYNYILRNWGTYNIVWLRRKNSADDRIEDIFKQLNQSPGGGVMKYKTHIVPDFLTVTDITDKLDSLRQNIIIAGSLDEGFGTRIATACVGLGKAYNIHLVGMPNWEGIKDLQRRDYSAIPIVYSSTFYNNSSPWSVAFEDAYKKRTYSKPTDLVYKGFEITYNFIKLLIKYDSTLVDHLDDKSFKVMTDFDFKPIRWNKSDLEPDYYENKRIYIVRRLNGVVTQLN